MRLFSILLLIVAAAPALAQLDSRPLSAAERSEKLGRASVLEGEADREQKAAEAALKAENEVCYKKFLVSDCLDAAKRKHTAAMRAAKNKELEAGELERDVKRRDVAADDARRAAEAPAKEAKQKAQAESYRAEEAAKAQARAEKQAKKEQKAAEGRRKHAEEQAKRQKKLEKHAAKEAKAVEKRKKREAEEAERAARKAAAASGQPPANP